MIDHQTTRAPLVQELLAANLRRLRIARHLSLSELARATAISKATLSSIESGSSNPTVETLAALAAALRVTLGELLEEAPLAPVRVLRAAEARRRERDGMSVRALERFDAEEGAQLSLAEIELPADHRREHAARPPGTRVGIYVLAGKVIAGPAERVTELAEGDYMTFPADVPHVFETRRRPARMLAAELSEA
jgi:transcriptional regulator with XRE-family HTH domain